MEFRHEYKYEINHIQKEVLRSRIEPLMQLDKHAGPYGQYEIRSVYFDDWQDTCFRQNEDGVNARAKYRIRSYNGQPEPLILEKKSKVNGMTKKEQQILTRQQYDMLISPVWDMVTGFHNQPPLVKELMLLKTTRQMMPKVVVAYKRTPFVLAEGNVRVTFDEQICSTPDVSMMFAASPASLDTAPPATLSPASGNPPQTTAVSVLHARPVLATGQLLMEVKFDEFLPVHIREALEIGSLSQTTFSKYYLCRRFHL